MGFCGDVIEVPKTTTELPAVAKAGDRAHWLSASREGFRMLRLNYVPGPATIIHLASWDTRELCLDKGRL